MAYKKGYTPWNKGGTHSDITKKKMSESHKGVLFTKERSNNISKANKGKKFTEQHKMNLSKARRGIKFTEEHIKNLSKCKMGKRPREKCHFWKGGITPISKAIRTMSNYLEWRSSVFKRDNYRCQHCGKTGYLEAHHIISFSKLLQEFNIKSVDDANECYSLWDIGNGITYCIDCHILLDKYRGRIIKQTTDVSNNGK